MITFPRHIGSFRPLRPLAVALVVISAACASTQLQRTWVKPDVGTLSFHSVLAMAISTDPARRRAMETSMAGAIEQASSDVRATPSYTVISDADMRQESRVSQELEHANVDAQVVMRVTDVTRNDVYVPGRTRYMPEYYRTFWGYYRYWVPIAYEPGYVEHDRNVQVETEVYSTSGAGELVYSAISQTLNPSSASDLAKDVAEVVTKDMREKGFLR